MQRGVRELEEHTGRQKKVDGRKVEVVSPTRIEEGWTGWEFYLHLR